jgi:hypothetical protein
MKTAKYLQTTLHNHSHFIIVEWNQFDAFLLVVFLSDVLGLRRRGLDIFGSREQTGSALNQGRFADPAYKPTIAVKYAPILATLISLWKAVSYLCFDSDL